MPNSATPYRGTKTDDGLSHLAIEPKHIWSRIWYLDSSNNDKVNNKIWILGLNHLISEWLVRADVQVCKAFPSSITVQLCNRD